MYTRMASYKRKRGKHTTHRYLAHAMCEKYLYTHVDLDFLHLDSQSPLSHTLYTSEVPTCIPLCYVRAHSVPPTISTAMPVKDQGFLQPHEH